MPPADPRGLDARVRRRWQGVGLLGISGIAVVLFVASLWQAGSSGASQPGVTAEPSARTQAPELPATSAPLVELPPVPLTEQVAPVPGVVFGIDALRSVEVVDPVPGEAAAPALCLTLTLRNDTDTAVSLGSTVVNLYAGPGHRPMPALPAADGAALPEWVAPGASATGDFVFAVPAEDRALVKIGVDYAVGVPMVVFTGAAPR